MPQQPAVPAGTDPNHRHQPGTALWPRRCCDRWPPANRVTTVRQALLERRRLMRAAVYTAWLLLTLVAVAAADTLLLPVTTAWASSNGIWGWALWLVWAAGSLTALHQGVLARRRSRTGLYSLHAAAVAAVYMSIAAPGGWIQALTATGGTAVAWLIAFIAARR